MRLHRFYISIPLGEEVNLSRKDFEGLYNQIINVLRIDVDDDLILFNGSGIDYTYKVHIYNRDSIKLHFVSQTNTFETNKGGKNLYISIIKRENFELIVEKAVEIGVSSLIPIRSERSHPHKLNYDRLNLIIKEATEQCGRGTLMKLEEEISLKEVSGDNIYALNKGDGEFVEQIQNCEGLIVGPEGGWSEGDIEVFKTNNIRFAQLKTNTLRAETAAIIAAYLL